MTWKRMSVMVLIISSLLVSTIMAVNYVVNPLGKYEPRYFPSLVWTARADKANLMEQYGKNPEVLVLGSSRSMKIDPDFIEKKTDKTSFNASVNSAMAEDYYSMLRYAVEEVGIKPKVVLLGIDVEAFHNNRDPDHRLIYNQAFSRYLNGADRPTTLERLKSMLTYEQTASSIRSLYFAATDYPERTATYDEDGFLNYPKKERQIEEGTFKLEIDEYIKKYRGRYNRYTAVDDERKQYFDKFLKLAEAHDIKVVSFITTLHDDVIKDLEKTRDYDGLKKDLTVFLSDMEKSYPHFSYRDFDRVAKYGGSPEQFYDGAHIREKNANLITTRLLVDAELIAPARAEADDESPSS